VSGKAVIERTTVNIPDTEEAPESEIFTRNNGRRLGFRAIAAAPLLRESEAIGAITVFLKEPGGLNDKQLTLLRTFSDQAVIAIENTRLFRELQERTQALSKSVGQLTALGEVSQALSSTLDLEKVLQTIVARAVQPLAAGTRLAHGERHAVLGVEPELAEAAPARGAHPVPYYLAAGCRLRTDVAAGALLTRAMLEPPAGSVLWRLREEQDAMFDASAAGHG